MGYSNVLPVNMLTSAWQNTKWKCKQNNSFCCQWASWRGDVVRHGLRVLCHKLKRRSSPYMIFNGAKNESVLSTEMMRRLQNVREFVWTIFISSISQDYESVGNEVPTVQAGTVTPPSLLSIVSQPWLPPEGWSSKGSLHTRGKRWNFH